MVFMRLFLDMGVIQLLVQYCHTWSEAVANLAKMQSCRLTSGTQCKAQGRISKPATKIVSDAQQPSVPTWTCHA